MRQAALRQVLSRQRYAEVRNPSPRPAQPFQRPRDARSLLQVWCELGSGSPSARMRPAT